MTNNHEIDTDQAARIFRSVFGTATSEARQNVVDAVDRYANELERECAEATEAVEAESFEFLNELALAFRAAENHPRPQCAPVLEGVRAVLAHLQSAGRLLADDEQRLTAEQVEDVRIVLGLNGSQDIKVVLDAQARLRALFPATEPTSYCSKGVCSANEGHDGTCAEASGWAHDAYEDDPAPAEPAEEETKAERDSQGIIRINGGRIVALSRDPRELVQQWYDLAEPGSKWQRDYAAALDLFDREATSSPVVPAPTETEAGLA